MRVLLTGMSGTGKSTVIARLRARGYAAVDMDEPGWSAPGPDGDWRWNEARLAALLAATADDAVLVISGCAENQRQFHPSFEKIVLLSAPADVIAERLRTRTTNDYGKDPRELAETLGFITTVEPLLRQRADVEIDTTAEVDAVVARIVAVLDDR